MSHACEDCGADLPSALLACPACGRLVHAAALKSTATEGEAAERAGDRSAALAAWRRVQDLLPVGSIQHDRVLDKIKALSAALDAAPGSAKSAAPNRRHGWGWLAGFGAIGLLLFKFKWVILFLLGKGKLLLVGLAQVKTLFSMALAIGVYGSALGWKFAGGLMASLYIHEMGHVVWLSRYGIAATAPMFIPGFGAFVRLKQYPATPAEDARVGLAGPVWGAAAAIAFLAIGAAMSWPSWVATARVGAWINLFNLLPVWQLDGGRGFRALSRRQRAWAAAVLWGLAFTSRDGLIFALAIAATLRAMGRSAPETPDRNALLTYAALTMGLTLLVSLAGRVQL